MGQFGHRIRIQQNKNLREMTSHILERKKCIFCLYNRLKKKIKISNFCSKLIFNLERSFAHNWELLAFSVSLCFFSFHRHSRITFFISLLLTLHDRRRRLYCCSTKPINCFASGTDIQFAALCTAFCSHNNVARV